MSGGQMQSDDLIKDEPLDRMSEGAIAPELDTLNHRAVASRVAELAYLSQGQLNVALFGPWGSGKSSFYGLMKEELQVLQKDILTVRFDAWKNSGPGFHSNFLHDIAAQIPHADKDIAKRLFQARKTVSLPTSLKAAWTISSLRGFWWKALPLLAGWFFVLPAIWSLLPLLTGSGQPYMETFWQSVSNWFTITYAPAILVLVVNAVVELSKVSIEESVPGSVSQFSTLFDEVVGAKNRRHVIFIDELDRCAPEDVIQTLEGLRTFLGHRNCVFVVAFDRKAVASTIGKHLHAKVPNRPDRPYYSTAGEYLDKIFQFQVSLPPQPPHTFRKYAFSLVKNRAGVWGELEPRVLARVVSILSPIHVTSPRRTKVLLNDFAVHVRILQSLGFNSKDRAEEIAALTVIQTEFPTFAADLEIEPGLLRAVAEQVEPQRPALLRLYNRYVGVEDRVGLDEIIAEEVESTPDSRESGGGSVEERLLQNLKRFLTLLHDMRCPLPKADLILMHSDGDLLSFDDPSVYNTVLLAADLPVDEVVAQLAACTPRDRSRAVEYLLEHVEGETPTEAANLVMIAGELVGEAGPEEVLKLAESLVHAWEQVTSNDPNEAKRFGADSLKGFAACHVAVRAPERVFSFYQLVKENNSDASIPVLNRIVLDFPTEDPNYHQLLAAEVAAVASYDVEPLGQFVQRLDTSSALTSDFARTAAVAFIVAPPEEVGPKSGPSAAVAAAQVENQVLREKYEDEVSEAEEEFGFFLTKWSDYSADGAAKSWLYEVLRTVGSSHEWALDQHDRLIESDVLAGFLRESNQELLLTLAAFPDEADRGWASKLHKDVSSDAKLLECALNAVAEVAADEAIDIQVRDAAARSALDISGCLSDDGGIDMEEVLQSVKVLTGRDWEASDAAGFSIARTVINAVSHAGGGADVCDLKTDLYIAAIESVDDASGFNYVIYSLREEPAEIVSAVADAAVGLAEGNESALNLFAVQVAVAAHNLLLDGGMRIKPLSASLVVSALEENQEAPVLRPWIQTCPSPAELNKVAAADIDVFSSPKETWQKYAARSNPADCSEVWLALRKAKAPASKLSAIASHGVERWLYNDIVDSIAQGINAEDRQGNQQILLSLPTGNADSAAATVSLADKLAQRARRTDAPIVVTYVLANQNSLSKAQKTKIASTAGTWLSESQSNIGKTNMKKLRDLGILPAKSSWMQSVSDALSG